MPIGKVALLVLTAAALSACSTLQPERHPLMATVRDCTKNQPRFVDAWGCVQTQYVSGQMGEADPKLAAFLKFGDDLAGQVSAKQMTGSEAKKRLLQGAATADRS